MDELLLTKITAVSVYQSGARITHIGEKELNPGTYKLKIQNLTKYLDKESVRVKGKGFGRIVNVIIDRHSTIESKIPELEVLRKKSEEIQKKMTLLQHELDNVNFTQENHVNFSKTFYQRAPVFYNKNDLDLNRLSEMDNYISKKSTELIENQIEIDEKLKKLHYDDQMIQQEIANLGSKRRVEEFFEIGINIEVEKKGKFEFDLQFQIPGAYWIPFYDVNLGEEEANFKLLANVFNTSGEDWENVDLEISSANLQPVRILKPNPLIVREYIPPVYDAKMRSAMPMAAPKPSARLKSLGGIKAESFALDEIASAPLAEPSPPPQMMQPMAKIDENLGVQSYKLPTKLNIPSDKNPHPITLMETSINSEKEYFWSVSASDLVIIQDKLSNDDNLFLPGNAKVYYAGEFIGESQIPMIAPFEKIDLGTRRTYDLKIEKKLKNRQSAKEGLLKGKVTKSYTYEISIKILKPSKNKLKIMDRIVHSDSEKIKVGKPTFSIEPETNEMGVLTWTLDLADKKEILLLYSYDVSWEKDIQIVPALP